VSRPSLEKCRYPNCPEPYNPATPIGLCACHWGLVPTGMQNRVTEVGYTTGRVPRDLQLEAITAIPTPEDTP
jgi:hypothetical protein